MKHLTLSLLILVATSLSTGEENQDPAAGHSYHGEVFNEGPRQAAVLIPGTGEVNFPVTTESGEAQKFFNQGIGQLHGFWDFEAERSFRQVAAIDPDCAMAYWGMAMANFKNNTRGKGFIDEAVERKEKASEREQLWIDGLAKYFENPKADAKKRLRDFVRSIEKIAMEFPDDLEAQAFLMRQIYHNHGKGLAIPSHYAINLLADKILTADPDHPSNHYKIHLWDRETPEKAIEAAANCGPSAPGIAHMWHMPGHIYSRLHRYGDASWQQEASARVDHAHMIRYQIVPDQIHNFAHNNEWCIRNFDYVGQHSRSVELASNMIELPRRAKFKKKDDDSTYDSGGSSWQYGRKRLRDTLVRYENWDRLIRESEEGMLVVDENTITRKDHDRFVGIANFESGDHDGGLENLASLQKILNEKIEKRDKAINDAETKAKDAKKKESEIKKARESAERNFKKDIETYQNLVNELLVYQFLTQPEPDKEAALELLPKLKNLSKQRHALLWLRAGNKEEALKLANEAVSSGKNQVLPLAAQVEVLSASEKPEELKKAFESLRVVAGQADLDTPTLARLAPIASSLGFPEDWRIPAEPAEDLGERPDLDSLGPFRWSPPSAPSFSLKNEKGESVSLSDYQGRPVLVIYFLGRGCTHCMEQLQAFSPFADKYRDAEIEILTVSTDTIEGIKETFQESEGEKSPFPFVMLSDHSLKHFKAYRAFDDFEDMALHGTFLIDGNQQIRWQDISYEPFMHPEWLLEECQRLLAIGKSES